MTNVKYASIDCNEKFINIYTETLVWNCCKDPLGYECFQALDADLYSIGDAVLKALDKSRDLTLPDEDRRTCGEIRLRDGVAAADQWVYEKHPEWKLFDRDEIEKLAKNRLEYWRLNYKIKTPSAVYKNMQIVDCELVDGVMSFFPNLHKVLRGWERCPKELQIHIPSSSPVEVVGAAAKYAIGNCRGKGADLIREILFPEGQPETFEEYLKVVK